MPSAGGHSQRLEVAIWLHFAKNCCLIGGGRIGTKAIENAMHTCENFAARSLPDAFSPRIFATVGRIRYACEAWHPTWSMRFACFGPAFLNRTCMKVHTYIADLIIPTFLLLIPMLGFWDLSSCLSVFLRFLWVVPQQKVRLR